MRTSFAIGARHARGFTLVEMMVALVASLIVIGAVLLFTVAMAKSTGDNIASARLTQDLRTANNLITSELRRAGYYRKNYDMIASNSFTQSYAGITISGSCLVMSYDRFNVNDGATTPGATEYKAFRRTTVGGVGVIQANLADNPPACNSNSNNWLTLTNSNVVDITALTFTQASSSTQVGTNPANGNAINVTVRDVTVAMTGRLTTDTNVSRSMSEIVRIRSDLITNP